MSAARRRPRLGAAQPAAMAAALAGAVALFGAPAVASDPAAGFTLVLGRPTERSATLNVRTDAALVHVHASRLAAIAAECAAA